MKILALDASTEALSAALRGTNQPGQALEHFEIAPRAHANRLLPVVQMLLDRAGWALADVDGLAFGRGPGAFTGLRIAAGLVQGLAYGLDRPVAPVSTLAAIAARCFAASHATTAQIVQDARMGEVYTAVYQRGDNAPQLVGTERVIEPRSLMWPAAAQATVRGGNGWPLVDAAGCSNPNGVAAAHPHAGDIARLAAYELAAGGGVSAAEALPVYVRDDVARKR